jgi:RNA polymerase sigma factor (sigma-70 family)
MTTDASLLRQFARDRDEAAFVELVNRHGGLVFHTALRRTRSHAMAQEVSQQVLCTLAQKAARLASIAEEGRLAPWLHRAATFEASNALRAEASQQRRKQLLHPDAMPATGPDHHLWEEALPHLDLALDKLGEGDRSVLILHFFRRQTFREIAATTGRSVDAVKKQSARALDKLSRILRSRGVVLPAGVLAAGLAAESAKAMPAALLPELAAGALSVSPAASSALVLSPHALLVMITTKAKFAVPLALLVCAIPAVILHGAVSRSERNLAAQRQHASATPATANPATTTRASKGGPRPVAPPTFISSATDWEALLQESLAIKTSAERAAFTAKLEAMSVADRIRAMRGAGQSETVPVLKAVFCGRIADSLSGSDPGLAFTTLFDLFKGSPSFGNMFNNAMGHSIFRDWVERDPAAVQAWLDDMEREKVAGNWIPDDLLGKFHLPLLNSLASRNPDAARTMLAGLDSEDSRAYLAKCSIVAYDDRNEGDGNAAETAFYLELVRQLPAAVEGDSALGDIAFTLASKTRIKDLDAWVALPQLTAAEKETLGANVAFATVCYPDDAPVLEGWLNKAMPRDAERLLQEARARGK